MKAMAITEKIIAAHAGLDEVLPNEIVEAKVDLVLANDITAPLSVDTLRKYGIKKVFDNEKVVIIPDHFTPNKDIKTAQEVKKLRQFAKDFKLKNFIEVDIIDICIPFPACSRTVAYCRAYPRMG